jgi:hypothetical protein
MKVNSDWSSIWTPKLAEEQLKGFKFNGPGLYIEKAETLYVEQLDDSHKWDHQHTQFRFYYYGVPYSETVFAHSDIRIAKDHR